MNFFLIIFLVIFGRANSSLFSYAVLNPDESQMMSNALRLINNNLKIYEFDGTTSGILNSLVLIWPVFFDLDITFLSTRLTAIVLISLILYLTFKIIRYEVDLTKSIVLISPLVFFFSLSRDPDFIHYSSELVSCFLLMLSYWILVKNYKNNKNYSYVILPFILGLILFAKIQFFPVGVVLFVLFLISIFLFKPTISKVFISFIAFSLSVLIILAPYYTQGTINDYFINYFEFSREFIEKSQNDNWIANLKFNGGNSLKDSSFRVNFFNHLLYNSAFHLFYLYFLSSIALLLLFKKKIKLISFINFKLIMSLLTTISIILVIIIPGKTHRHYLIVLMPFLPIILSNIIKQLDLNSDILKFRKLKTINIFFLFIFLFSLLSEPFKFYAKSFQYTSFNIKNIKINSPEIFKYFQIEENQNKNLYIWGWMPQWHTLSNFSPASRESISEKQIEYSKRRNYYRNRLMDDLKKSSPNLIIDYIKPNSFRYNDTKLGIGSFLKLKSFVSNNYTRLKKYESSCPDYYLEKNSYKNLEMNLINFFIEDKKNTKRFKKLDDFSVTEDVCDDSVVFNEKDDNIIKIKFTKPEKVKKIMILGSRKNLEEIKVELSVLYQEKKIEKKFIYIKKFPAWTTYNLDPALEVENILLNIENLKFKNYGLNEIKFYR